MSKLPAPRKTSRWRRWILEIVIFTALFIGFQMWQLRDTTRGPLPHFHGPLLDGSRFDSAAWRRQHPDRALLIYFWADWCPICKTTAASVSSLAEDQVLITIATQSGDAAALSRFMSENGYRWPTLNDPQGIFMKTFGIPGTPAFVIIAPDGNIRFVTVGYTSEIGLCLRLWWANRTTGSST
ncbi:protein disulfide oxidoreductase [Azonexus sp.]|uniref:protein disulfide oxidoreductase n=1 Tax=Azonexus sp. TaxID=1872668 RepID=UPI0027BA14D9|nr:protein disulfide oxidoreductase [Azonexus sp.]